jgi:hypothetical protein
MSDDFVCDAAGITTNSRCIQGYGAGEVMNSDFILDETWRARPSTGASEEARSCLTYRIHDQRAI